MKPRLIAFDLDDTVLGSDGTVCAENLAALQKMQQAGFLPAVVTGRTYYEIPAVLRNCPAIAFYIYSDGAAAVNRSGEYLFEQYFSRKEAERVLLMLRAYDTMPEVFYAGRPYAEKSKLNTAAYRYYNIEPVYHSVLDSTRVACGDLHTLLLGEEKTEIFNVFFHDNRQRSACMAQLEHDFSGFRCTYSMQSNLEVLQKGVNKGAGLSRLARMLGIAPQEIVAVGDSRNDLQMIAYAGRGLAVANACSALKAAAYATICSNDEPVLEYIYQHFCG